MASHQNPGESPRFHNPIHSPTANNTQVNANISDPQSNKRNSLSIAAYEIDSVSVTSDSSAEPMAAAGQGRKSPSPASSFSATAGPVYHNAAGVRKIKLAMYTFGCPRVGNPVFAKDFNTRIPDSFRVVVDGDIVSGIPKGSYKHVGTEIMVDGLGAGSIIIDPSYLEKRLRTRTKAHVSVHSLIIYRKALLGVREAAEYMRSHATHAGTEAEIFDPVKLAMRAGPLHGRRKGKSSANDNANDVESSGDSSPYGTFADNQGGKGAKATPVPRGSRALSSADAAAAAIAASSVADDASFCTSGTPFASSKKIHDDDDSEDEPGSDDSDGDESDQESVGSARANKLQSKPQLASAVKTDEEARHLQHDLEVHRRLFAAIKKKRKDYEDGGDASVLAIGNAKIVIPIQKSLRAMVGNSPSNSASGGSGSGSRKSLSSRNRKGKASSAAAAESVSASASVSSSSQAAPSVAKGRGDGGNAASPLEASYAKQQSTKNPLMRAGASSNAAEHSNPQTPRSSFNVSSSAAPTNTRIITTTTSAPSPPVTTGVFRTPSKSPASSLNSSAPSRIVTSSSAAAAHAAHMQHHDHSAAGHDSVARHVAGSDSRLPPHHLHGSRTPQQSSPLPPASAGTGSSSRGAKGKEEEAAVVVEIDIE